MLGWLKDQVWNNIYIYLALPCLKVIKFFLSSISAVSFVDHIIMYIMYQQFWNMWCGSHVEANFRTPSYLKLKVLTTWHYLRAKSKHLHCFHIFRFVKNHHFFSTDSAREKFESEETLDLKLTSMPTLEYKKKTTNTKDKI